MDIKELKSKVESNTISDELTHYRNHLRGKIVYLNCDDPFSSNFWRYFHNNFASLGLTFNVTFPLFSTISFLSKKIEFKVSQLGTATKFNG